ncbi:MAG: ankyrin repeat domain-containing protein [Thermofilaceae archaeon]
MKSEVIELKKLVVRNDIATLRKNSNLLHYAEVQVGNYAPLHLAVKLGLVEIVKLMLEFNKELVDWGNWKRKDEYEKLMNFGIEVPDEAPIHVAAKYCRPEVAALLLQYGADPNARDKWGKTPLHYAASRGCASVVELLLKHGADPYVRDKFHREMAYEAARSPHVAYLFLRHGVDDERLERIVAEYICYEKFVSEYLDVLPADVVSFCTSDDFLAETLERGRYDAAIAIAARAGDAAIVEKILAKRPELAPLALKFATSPVVLEAVERHYKPTAEELQVLFDEAVARGRVQLVVHLLDRHSVKISCAHLMKVKEPEVAEAILSRERPQCDSLFETHLDNADVLEVLLRYYEPPPEALCYALEQGRIDAALMLARHVSFVYPGCICSNFDEAVVMLLLQRGVLDPNTVCNGTPLLHLAAWRCNRALAKLLIERGADVMATDSNGNLAAEVACDDVLDLFS